jgi:alpha-D-ribose 1-methylphosphonate 5-triphosphate synthase subunit PhnI
MAVSLSPPMVSFSSKGQDAFLLRNDIAFSCERGYGKLHVFSPGMFLSVVGVVIYLLSDSIHWQSFTSSEITRERCTSAKTVAQHALKQRGVRIWKRGE